MRKAAGPLALVACLLASAGAVAQYPDAHIPTYNETIRAVDTAVSIGGKPYRISRVPVVEHGTGQRYALTFARQLSPIAFTPTLVWLLHRDDNPIPPNTMIGGFPAFVGIYETMNYYPGTDGMGGYRLSVTRPVSAGVIIDIGETLVQIADIPTFLAPQLTNVDVGPTLNLVPFAQWRKYADDQALLNAADKWIDFIRTQPL